MYSFSEIYIKRDCQMSLTDFRVARCLVSSYADAILHWLSTNTMLSAGFGLRSHQFLISRFTYWYTVLRSGKSRLANLSSFRLSHRNSTILDVHISFDFRKKLCNKLLIIYFFYWIHLTQKLNSKGRDKYNYCDVTRL